MWLLIFIYNSVHCLVSDPKVRTYVATYSRITFSGWRCTYFYITLNPPISQTLQTRPTFWLIIVSRLWPHPETQRFHVRSSTPQCFYLWASTSSSPGAYYQDDSFENSFGSSFGISTFHRRSCATPFYPSLMPLRKWSVSSPTHTELMIFPFCVQSLHRTRSFAQVHSARWSHGVVLYSRRRVLLSGWPVLWRGRCFFQFGAPHRWSIMRLNV